MHSTYNYSSFTVNSMSLRRQSEICKSNVISYDVTLRGGKYAGKYKAFGPVNDMAECIRVCCMERYCDLAFMINGTCFTVRCHTEEACQEVRSPGTGFKPMISYVVRERRHHDSHDGENLRHDHHGKGNDGNKCCVMYEAFEAAMLLMSATIVGLVENRNGG